MICMYVDDCLTGANDEEEAVKFQKALTECYVIT
jgi:hypothetical protein